MITGFECNKYYEHTWDLTLVHGLKVRDQVGGWDGYVKGGDMELNDR